MSPLTTDELLDTFATTTPTSSQVQEWMKNGASPRMRWVGTYVISYHDGQPDHIHFCGYSGD